jgi:autoinducer 2-degrading protein
VAAHKKTEHYLAWRERVAPWMARPREGRSFTPLFPEGKTQW